MKELRYSIQCGRSIPAEMADDLFILPDNCQWLVYLANRHNREPGHSTIPDAVGNSHQVSVASEWLRAVDADAKLRHSGIVLNLSNVDTLYCLADTVGKAHAEGRVLWYPMFNVELWLNQLHHETSWWPTLLQVFRGSRLPSNPLHLAEIPTCPKSWRRTLEAYIRQAPKKTAPEKEPYRQQMVYNLFEEVA